MVAKSLLVSSGARRCCRDWCPGLSVVIGAWRNAPSARGRVMSDESQYDAVEEERSREECGFYDAKERRGRHFPATNQTGGSFRAGSLLSSPPVLLRPDPCPAGSGGSPPVCPPQSWRGLTIKRDGQLPIEWRNTRCRERARGGVTGDRVVGRMDRRGVNKRGYRLQVMIHCEPWKRLRKSREGC